MRIIKVTYHNITMPNKNNHLYPEAIWKEALEKFRTRDFWVVSEPTESIELKDVVGRVTDFEFSKDMQQVSFEIYVHQDWVDIDKMFFCLFGMGDVSLEDINSEITTVKTFNALGLFLADSCAWDYNVELLEEVNDETNN